MLLVLTTRLRLVFILWVIAETLAFLAVAKAIGIGGALLAGLLTSLYGAVLLKRTGAAAMMRLRGELTGRGEGARGDMLDAGLRGLGAIALLIPGFLSDAVGLALGLPAVRAAAIRRFRGEGWHRRFGETGLRHGPSSIDLAPQEWTSGGPPSRR